jgi:hypothetical protein
MMPRHLHGAITVVMALSVLTVSSCIDSTPDSPENVVMDYLTAAQVNNEKAARTRLCSRLRESADEAELATLDRLVHRAAAFGEGLGREDRNSATVMLRVVFAPSPPGAEGEPWEARLVKEGGRWKVCGFAPAEG